MTYIVDINPATPGGSDAIANGDNEIRTLKTDIKNSFPKIAGEMSASQTELNRLVGLTGNILTSSGGSVSGTLVLTGPVSLNNDLSISGAVVVNGTTHFSAGITVSGTITVGKVLGETGFFGGAVTLSATAVFISAPKSVGPTSGSHLATKTYVDGAVAAGSDPTTVDIREFKNSRLKMFFYGSL